ncbi:MAG: sensor histidine kinase [Opitutales bacterium]
MPDKTPLHKLADALHSDLEHIVDCWLDRSEADENLEVVSTLSRFDFRNNIPNCIEVLANHLRQVDRDELDDSETLDVEKHGHHRWKQGFNLMQIARDWGNLNEVLIDFFEARFANNPEFPDEDKAMALKVLAKFMTDAIGASIQRFDDMRRSEALSFGKDLETVYAEFNRITQMRAQMLTETAHDLKGSLATASGASELLSSEKDASESQAELTGLIQNSMDTVVRLLDSMLDLSRLESGQEKLELSKVDVGDLLRSIGQDYLPLAERKGLELEMVGEDNILLETDPLKLRRILQNLMNNAFKYTLRGMVQLSWYTEKDCWRFIVRDTGPGLQNKLGSPIAQEMRAPDEPSEEQEAYTTVGLLAYDGEGIGLTIVKRLCELLLATINIESEPGQGTAVVVQLPLGYGKRSPVMEEAEV